MLNEPVLSIDRLLPQNIEAEQSVLGSLLIDRVAIARIATFLRPEDFYLPIHVDIYAAMLDLYRENQPSDLVTLSDHLDRRSKLDQVGGLAYLTELANAVPTAVNIEHYGRIVERLATLRRLIDAGTRITAIGYDEAHSAERALEKAEEILFEVSQGRMSSNFESIRAVLTEYYSKLDYIHEHRGHVTGTTTGFIDLDKITGGLQASDLVILAARPSMGKCLTAGTLIDDPMTGARLTIASCVQRHQSHVFGLDDAGCVRVAPVADWVDSGVQPCFRVTTRTGRSVETTWHHPFLTVHGWTPLHDLRPGNRIAVPRAVSCFGSDTSMHIDLVRLLAYFVAEGGLTRTCPQFTNTEPALIADFEGIIACHFPGCHLRCDRITYAVARSDWRVGDKNVMRGGSNPVTAWLRGLGLMGKGSDEKRFPAEVWQWDRERLATFVRVLMSCDGTIYSLGGYPRIEFAVASQGLAEDVHHALTRFGVVSKLWQKKQRCWRVEITEPESVATYQAAIGWIGEKAQRFVPVDGPARSERRSNVGHAPSEAWGAVRSAAIRRGLSLQEVARRSGEHVPPSGGYNAHTNRGIPRTRLSAYASVLEDPVLERMASPDIYWDEVVTIEAIGNHQVYDLCVPDAANFIAQDVCVHNTSLALNIAHAAAARSKMPVGVFSLEMSAEQLVQRLLSMEAQIDSQHLRTGYISDDEWERLGQAIGELSEVPIFIDDTANISVTEMRSKSRRLHMEQGLGLIVLDYLQLMHGSTQENRVQEISEISRSLKGLARELNVPILALSQLSRAPDQRPNHVPMLSDLRESGCLTGDTRVFLPGSCQYARMDELAGNCGFSVLALNTDTWRLETRTVTRAFSTGRKPVYRMTTRLGRSIRATGNHRFRTLSGWTRLDQLDCGDRIAVPRHSSRVYRSTLDELCLPSTDSARPRANQQDLSSVCSAVGSVPASLAAHDAPRQPLLASSTRCAVQHGDAGTEALHYIPLTRTPSMPWVNRPGSPITGDIQASRESTAWLGGSVESDVYWDEVSSIEPDGHAEVYDLTVDGLHNFVAEDIVVHNSIEQDADVVIFIYRDVVYNRETDRPNVADVIVAKHRNGPTGEAHLLFKETQTRFLDLAPYEDTY